MDSVIYWRSYILISGGVYPGCKSRSRATDNDHLKKKELSKPLLEFYLPNLAEVIQRDAYWRKMCRRTFEMKNSF